MPASRDIEFGAVREPAIVAIIDSRLSAAALVDARTAIAARAEEWSYVDLLLGMLAAQRTIEPSNGA